MIPSQHAAQTRQAPDASAVTQAHCAVCRRPEGEWLSCTLPLCDIAEAASVQRSGQFVARCRCIEPMPSVFPPPASGTPCDDCGGHLDAEGADHAGQMRITRAFERANATSGSGIAGLDVQVLA